MLRIAIVARSEGAEDLNLLLSLMQTANEWWLRGHPTAALYESGIRWHREDASHEGHNEERWLTVPEAIAAHQRGGYVDCEDLATWRAAELVVSGEDPFAKAVCRQPRPGLWHIVVKRGDGSIEDPSRVLGMGS